MTFLLATLPGDVLVKVLRRIASERLILKALREWKGRLSVYPFMVRRLNSYKSRDGIWRDVVKYAQASTTVVIRGRRYTMRAWTNLYGQSQWLAQAWVNNPLKDGDYGVLTLYGGPAEFTVCFPDVIEILCEDSMTAPRQSDDDAALAYERGQTPIYSLTLGQAIRALRKFESVYADSEPWELPKHSQKWNPWMMMEHVGMNHSLALPAGHFFTRGREFWQDVLYSGFQVSEDDSASEASEEDVVS